MFKVSLISEDVLLRRWFKLCIFLKKRLRHGGAYSIFSPFAYLGVFHQVIYGVYNCF